MWKVFVKDYGVVQWAYVLDLLPKGDGDMTTEEFNAIKWRLVSHLSMSSTHFSTYEGEWNGITITMQAATRVLECGGYGKTRVAYWIRERKFKKKEELIKYINELVAKGGEE